MSDTPRSFHSLLSGVLFGLAAGDLMAGLNHQTASSPGVVLILAAGAFGGFLLASPVYLLSRREPPGRAFWGSFSLASGLFAILVESQRQLYYGFLSNGIRRLLVTTTVLLSISAVVGFWALVLGTSQRRAARLLSILCLLLATAPLTMKRQPDPVQLSAVPQIPKTKPRSVLVIGIEGASWDFVSAAASDGTLPVLSRLMQQGVSGPLEALAPYDRAALWATAATGKRPMKHQELSSSRWETPAGTLRLLPRLFGLPAPDRFLFYRAAPGDDSTRKSLAFWEILARRGHESVLANWPESYPPRPGLTLWASDRAFDTPPAPDHSSPPEQQERVRLFRTGPENLDKRLSGALLPKGLPSEDVLRTNPLEMAARDLSVAGITLATLPAGPASVATVVFSGLTPLSRYFGPSVAQVPYVGRQPRNTDERSRALTAYYKLLDDLIGDFVEREGRDWTIVVFSPVSYGPPPSLEGAFQFLSGREPMGSPYRCEPGFLIIAGPGIRSGARLTSATVYDLAPTILVLAGEPIARDFDGRVLGEAFDERFAETASFPVVVSFEPGGPQ